MRFSSRDCRTDRRGDASGFRFGGTKSLACCSSFGWWYCCPDRRWNASGLRSDWNVGCRRSSDDLRCRRSSDDLRCGRSSDDLGLVDWRSYVSVLDASLGFRIATRRAVDYGSGAARSTMNHKNETSASNDDDENDARAEAAGVEADDDDDNEETTLEQRSWRRKSRRRQGDDAQADEAGVEGVGDDKETTLRQTKPASNGRTRKPGGAGGGGRERSEAEDRYLAAAGSRDNRNLAPLPVEDALDWRVQALQLKQSFGYVRASNERL